MLRQRALGMVAGPLLGLLCLACSATVFVGGPNQPCSPIARFANRFGVIAAQQPGPGGAVVWGVYPAVAATGFSVDVYVDGKRVDHKDQAYPPHGSVNPKDLRSGALVSIVGRAKAPGGELNYGLLCRSA